MSTASKDCLIIRDNFCPISFTLIYLNSTEFFVNSCNELSKIHFCFFNCLTFCFIIFCIINLSICVVIALILCPMLMMRWLCHPMVLSVCVRSCANAHSSTDDLMGCKNFCVYIALFQQISYRTLVYSSSENQHV